MFSITKRFDYHMIPICHSNAPEVNMMSRILQFVQMDENFTNCKFSDGHCSVQQKDFCIGCNVYSKCEVVAMEWLVQEVLNFQCFLPTMFNFLW
jgi:hypothetical protein